MNHMDQARVLNRRGARELSKEEVHRITGRGASVHTRLTDIITGSSSSPDHFIDE
jgi:hypothetical protein